MSDTIFALEAEMFDLYVTRLAGPAAEGSDRARWEIMVRDEEFRAGSVARLTRGEIQSLISALEISAAE